MSFTLSTNSGSVEFEALGAMRLNAEQSEHARHRALREAGGLRGGTHRPVRTRRWFQLKNRAQKLGDGFLVMGSRASRASFAV